jgi:molybdate transport system substrate-binding protein
MHRKLLLVLLLISSLSASSLKVAVASNVRFALEEIAAAYEKKARVKIIPIVSSSGKLTAQIEHGAKFDLFLSANMKYPEYLYAKQLAKTEPKIYAYGSLVLWSTNKKVDINLKALKDDVVRKIAIPNPKLAPYGVEALKVLEKHNLKDEVFTKIV